MPTAEVPNFDPIEDYRQTLCSIDLAFEAARRVGNSFTSPDGRVEVISGMLQSPGQSVTTVAEVDRIRVTFARIAYDNGSTFQYTALQYRAGEHTDAAVRQPGRLLGGMFHENYQDSHINAHDQATGELVRALADDTVFDIWEAQFAIEGFLALGDHMALARGDQTAAAAAQLALSPAEVRHPFLGTLLKKLGKVSLRALLRRWRQQPDDGNDGERDDERRPHDPGE